jgi:diguanylate cyclase
LVEKLKKMSRRGRWMLARWTCFGTLGCILVAVAVNLLVFRDLGPEAVKRAVLTGTLIPILLAGPLFFYLTLKMRELAIANHKLGVVASTDCLTECLNRGAFSSLVDAWLDGGNETRRGKGGFLVIDADHFKAINDRFGHAQGDEALRIISGSIRSVLRGGDIVGRLGGEEFGVFLPGASPHNAAEIAERIRKSIQAASFKPNGKTCALTVSVGGATFEEQIPFSELFRIADQRLYDAKNAGRNRIALTHVPPLAPELSTELALSA